MNHNPGKLILFLSFVFLQAEDFSHIFHVDKTESFVKEAVVLTLELAQTNPNKVLMFDFDLVKSENYTFQRLDTHETDNHPTKGLHAVHVKYVYLVYPLHSGKVDLHFNLLKKVTTDDSVAYSFSGDRDNVKGLVTNDTIISLAPLTLHVKTLPQGTQIVGDFSLDYRLQKHKANAYEPLPFQVTVKGLGYPPLLDIIPKDVNFTVFTEKPLLESLASIHGTRNTVHYPMALSYDRNFTLPDIVLKAFNPETEKSYILAVPEQTFNITEIPKSSLLDKVDSPKRVKTNWSWLENIFTYLLVFSAGYLTALSWKWTKKKQTNKKQTKTSNPLKVKVQNAKDAKALLQVLLANDSHHFAQTIEVLENSLYANGKINLNKIKQEVMDKL